MNVENNSRTITPEHHVKPAKTNYQKAGPAIRKENLAKSAKPPSPVQIRAAPPNLQCKFDRLSAAGNKRTSANGLQWTTNRASASCSNHVNE
jgi:hypothetical protein